MLRCAPFIHDEFAVFPLYCGTIYSCPLQMGNIAERLIKEGFARCVDWSMAMVSKDKEKLRSAEK